MLVLTIAIVVVHSIVSLMLLGTVLLHSGRGGGLSDMFGGGIGASALGSSVAEKNLDRITVTCALIFTFTTIGLGIILSR
ncbi:MAG: preprotein translocase subunit SecG [Actinobacteria bacterium]|nr:preprotein translocase subunit SecG [Actinomycetota bacterium]